MWWGWIEAGVRFLSLAKNLGYVGIGVTPSAIADRLNLAGAPAVALLVLGAVLGAVCVWIVFRATEDPTRRIAALVTGGLLCTPYALNYELAALAPAASVIIWDRSGSRLSWVAAALAFTAAAGPASVIVFAVALILEQGSRRPDSTQRDQGAAASDPTIRASCRRASLR